MRINLSSARAVMCWWLCVNTAVKVRGSCGWQAAYLFCVAASLDETDRRTSEDVDLTADVVN